MGPVKEAMISVGNNACVGPKGTLIWMYMLTWQVMEMKAKERGIRYGAFASIVVAVMDVMQNRFCHVYGDYIYCLI